MKKQICFLVLFLVLAAPCQEQMSLAVFEPQGKGLSKDEMWMPSLVQSSIVADFNKYSRITIIDKQNLEAIIVEQKRSPSAITSDKDAIAIGNLANASHILTGKITKTPNAFMLELAVTDVKTGERKASHSPQAVTPSQLEDLSALKEASADLLKQLGVSLTDSQLAELNGPAAFAQVQAQTALAHGVVAERQGTSVAALSYFYQAAAFDHTLIEAVKRSSVMSANISGINIGDNIRNDIVWRKKWIEQLKETEETFYKIINSADPPYILYYSTVIETKNINYQKETADLSISLNLLANAEWFTAMQRSLKAAQAVMDGLNATGRKKDWGLDKWPEQGVTETNPVVDGWEERNKSSKSYNISVGFELVNQRGRVIGWQVANLNPSFKIDRVFVVEFNPSQSGILIFNAVNANDISDKLTIRLASVNDASPKTARFPIIAVSTKEFPEYKVQNKRTTFTDSRDGKKYKAVEIGTQTWMAENLNFNASGKCYGNNPANCSKYGRLYNWNAAMKACPKGWHLPSDSEVGTLTASVGGESKWAWGALESEDEFCEEIKAGKVLRAKSGWNSYSNSRCEKQSRNGNGTDLYGFSALPGGHGGPGYFEDVGDNGYWWNSHGGYYNSGSCYTGSYKGKECLFFGDDVVPGFFSVRCVKD